MTETSGSYTSDSDLTDTSDELYSETSDDDYEHYTKNYVDESTDSDETDDGNDTSMTSSEQNGETVERKNKQQPRNKSEDFTDEDDVILVTQSERELQEARKRKGQEALNESRRKFEHWAEKITQRRMYALSDFKTLQRKQKERMQFYEDVKNFVKKNKVASRKGKQVKTSVK
ncbi:uncharacterized protein LOC127866821 [Dreissena polymorpha]|uniref:Uncharacterized protein n=1 Tax=Dreissena polymorpha TaxID=45954 RepID=A0A9D4MWU4_DREPO|nr:uncharacterized protein LOC127866821 [Dreissena polymorpha]KAH3883204.1 hypothetical protein DPMN_007158 [Dreissena polymorpha]